MASAPHVQQLATNLFITSKQCLNYLHSLFGMDEEWHASEMERMNNEKTHRLHGNNRLTFVLFAKHEIDKKNRK